MAGPAARALLLLAVLALLLRDAQAQVQPVAQAPSPPSAPPALQCAPEAEAAARDRDAAVRRWHAALQVREWSLRPRSTPQQSLTRLPAFPRSWSRRRTALRLTRSSTRARWRATPARSCLRGATPARRSCRRRLRCGPHAALPRSQRRAPRSQLQRPCWPRTATPPFRSPRGASRLLHASRCLCLSHLANQAAGAPAAGAVPAAAQRVVRAPVL